MYVHKHIYLFPRRWPFAERHREKERKPPFACWIMPFEDLPFGRGIPVTLSGHHGDRQHGDTRSSEHNILLLRTLCLYPCWACGLRAFTAGTHKHTYEQMAVRGPCELILLQGACELWTLSALWTVAAALSFKAPKGRIHARHARSVNIRSNLERPRLCDVARPIQLQMAIGAGSTLAATG